MKNIISFDLENTKERSGEFKKDIEGAYLNHDGLKKTIEEFDKVEDYDYIEF